MVVPMPAITINPIPTDYAVKCRNWFYSLACCMVACSFLQMFVLLNIAGGFMLLVIASIGFYTIRDNSIDMNCLMTWGMICLVNGVFDAVFLIDRAVKWDKPMFTRNVEHPLLYNTIHFFIVAGPTAEMCVSYIVYAVYKEATEMEGTFQVENSSRQNTVGGTGAQPGYGTTGASGQSANSPANRLSQQTFTPFAGQGSTLGD